MFEKSLLEQFKTNRNERFSILTLLVLLFLISGFGFVYPKLYPSKKASPQKLSTILEKYENLSESKIAELEEESTDNNYNKKFPATANQNSKSGIKNNTATLKPFNFNPNTASKEELIALGISSGRANVLINFRNSGFKFKSPEDLLKVRHFSQKDYEKLKDYVTIPQRKFDSKPYPKKETKKYIEPKAHLEFATNTDYKPKQKLLENKLLVNSATSTEFQQLYGIGEFSANKIITYRTRLGGFTNTDQVLEAYDFPDSTAQVLKQNLQLDTIELQQININEVSFKDILRHPYIDYEQNKILYPFIERRRPVKDLNILYDMHVLDSVYISKLIPYFRID